MFINDPHFDIYEATGLRPEMFWQLHEKIAEDIARPRIREDGTRPERETTLSLTTATRLLLFLIYVRDAPKLSALARQFGVTRQFVQRDIVHILPIVYSVLNFIHPFRMDNIADIFGRKGTRSTSDLFPGLIGAVDGTAHRRDRVHPGQAWYYRGDKHYHFILAQVGTLLCGIFCSIQLFRGHNNDQGAFNMSDFKEELDRWGRKVAGDGGYRKDNVYSQYNVPPQLLRELNKLRSIVETSIGYAATFQVAARRCKLSPVAQAYLLMVAYELAQWKMIIDPLRPDLMEPNVRDAIREFALTSPFGDWDALFESLRP